MFETPEYGVKFRCRAAQRAQPHARVLRDVQRLVQGQQRRPGGCFIAVDGVDDAPASTAAAIRFLQDPAGGPGRGPRISRTVDGFSRRSVGTLSYETSPTGLTWSGACSHTVYQAGSTLPSNW